ncbi:Glycosyl hydrolase superfamily protein [Forsythia ovata]|uniref:Glycosyl hydrolase superfamily protein n=1 Tax=Forsythia ovata TaxID=205694 RepID=A0ABD1W5T6_9LAMI
MVVKKFEFEVIFLFLFLLSNITIFCNSLPLSTSSRWIVDQKTGIRVKLGCVNWVSHLQPMIAEGLEKKPVKYISGKVSSMGFNCVRFTWATYMFTRANYSKITVSQSLDDLGLKQAKAGIAKNNPQLLNLTVVDLHKAVVSELGKNNIMVVLDNHISQPCTVVVAMSMRNELRSARQNEGDWRRYMEEDQRGVNEADNRYISCLLATVAENDIDWALWTFQGSYILREGKANLYEAYGVLDINWDRAKNPTFLERLQLIKQINQDVMPIRPTYYLLYHPLSGQCVQFGETVSLTNCKTASRFDQHKDGGPIKLTGSLQCLGVAGNGIAARASNDCSSKWRSVSSSRLHLAAPNGQGKFLCLEMNAADSTIMTKKCLCFGDNLQDAPNCPQNPVIQWFKLVPANV